MTERFELWQTFLLQRDQAIVMMLAMAVLLSGNWLLFGSRPRLRRWMLLGGVVTYVVIFVIGGG